MATRRSRLQIKPNILGGIKPSSGKVAGSTGDKPGSTGDNTKITNNEIVDSAEINSCKVKSPTRIMSPRRSVNTAKHSDDVNEISAEKSCNKQPVLVSDNAKSQMPALPTRARLRKFGKVNVGAARGLKTNQSETSLVKETNQSETSLDKTNKSQTNLDKETNQLQTSLDNTVTDDKTIKPDQVLPTTTDVKLSAEDKISKSTENSKSCNTASIPRRSRFPKAKPNIADIGRRKQRTKADTEKFPQSKDGGEDVIPEITVSDGKETADLPSKDHRVLQQQDLHVERNQQLTAAHTSSTTPTTVIPKSPIKHLLPTITPDKRSRTFSISEPVVVKRQRKAKVDAPTDQPPDRTTMKMRDLIRWNPTNNPMKMKEANDKPETVKEKEKENVVRKEPGNSESTSKTADTEDDGLPVPQVTIGPDGNIVINEKSLVVKDAELEKARNQQEDVIDETETFTTYGSFRKNHRTKRWSEKDTKKFYKALAMIGIDFFLICQLFPGRTRVDIKKKFQKEEKVNRGLVEKVLRERINFDPAMFDASESAESSEEEIKKPKKSKSKKPPVESSAKTTKARPSRKRHNPSYYDDDTSDEDDQQTNEKVIKITENVDEPWQPPSVSQKDGEVVGILMDMSEGRLNSEGQLDDIEETFTATPLNLSHEHNNLTGANADLTHKPSSNSTVNSSRTFTDTVTSSYDSLDKHVPEGMTIGSLGALQSVNSAGALQSTNTIMNVSDKREETVANSSNTGASSSNTGASSSNTGASSSNTGASSSNTGVLLPVEYSGSCVSGLNITSLQQATSLLPRQQSVNTEGSSVGTEENDQYVLVTVVPEGGGETVIHVYRLHGGVVVDTESPQPQLITSSPQVITTSPQVVTTSPQVVTTSPQVVTTSPQVVTTSPQVVTTSPQVVTTSPQVVTSSPQVVPTSPQVVNTSPQVVTTSPQVVTQSPQVVTTSPQVVTTSPQVVTTSPKVVTTLPQVITTSPQVITTSSDVKITDLPAASV